MRTSQSFLAVAALLCSEASGSFRSEDPKQINFKVAVIADDAELAASVVTGLHAGLPETSQKEDLRSVVHGTFRTSFFAFSPPGMGLLDGYQPRLHYYVTEPTGRTSAKEREVAETRLLAGADVVVVAVRCDSSGGCDGNAAEARAKAILEGRRMTWDDLLVVHEVHGKGVAAAPDLDAAQVGLRKRHTEYVVRAGGSAAEVARLLAEHDPSSTVASTPVVENQVLVKRTTFLTEWFKAEGASEVHTVAAKNPGEPDVNVFRFPASEARGPHETYATMARRVSPYEVVAQVSGPSKQVPEILAGIDVARAQPYQLIKSTRGDAEYLAIPFRPWAGKGSSAGVEFLQLIPVTVAEARQVKETGGKAFADRLKLEAAAGRWKTRR